MGWFHKNTTDALEEDIPQHTKQQLTVDSSVSEWLEHPVGGAIFRDMLHKAGQDEKVLRPVRRLSLKRLISMSHGQFTQAMADEMVRKANAGEMPAGIEAAAIQPSNAPASQPASQQIVWQEKITPSRFAGKTVVITGAGSGIGKATAARAAREGGRVIAVDISEQRLTDLKNSLPEADIIPVTADIAKEEDIEKIISAAGETIDCLANIAGIMDNVTPIHEVSDEIWDRVIDINVTGMMRLSRKVIPKMLSKHSGTVVNVGSEASFKGSDAGVAYTTSKHAVVGLSKSMAYMYGPNGIRTNVVAPGPVLTNIEAKFESKLGSERVNAALSIMPDAAEPEHLAASITFLLSDDSININGAVLPSDNGWSVE